MTFRKGLIVLSLGCLTAAVPATAGFVGQTASVEFDWPDRGTVLYPAVSAVVAAGGTNFFMPQLSDVCCVTITDTNILVSYPSGWFFSTNTPKTFDGWVITALQANITGVSVATTNVSGFTVTSDNHHVYISDLVSAQYPPGAFISVNVQFGCQVNLPVTFSQFNPLWNSPGELYDSTNSTIAALGCALTSLAMCLQYAGVGNINFPVPGTGLDPGSLNTFMNSKGGYYNPFPAPNINNGGVIFSVATGLVGSYNALPIRFDTSNGGQDSIVDQLAAYAALDNALCGSPPLPIIVGVRSGGKGRYPPPSHYVVVTGNTGIPDPAAPGRNIYSIADPSGFGTTLDDYLDPLSGLPEFVTRGSVSDPPAVRGDLNITTGNNADVLVIDQNGNSTGFNSDSASIVRAIPMSAYFRDTLDNDITGQPGTGITHSINIFQPSIGAYQVVITGVNQGTDALLVYQFAADGSTQHGLSLPVITRVSTTATYQVLYSPVSGSNPQISLSPSSQGTVPPSQVVTTASGLAYSRVSQTFNGTVTIKNLTSSVINGPLQIVLISLTPGVTLVNGTASFADNPFITVPFSGALGPGQSSVVTVQFRNPSNALINFTPVVYSGSLN